MSVRMSVVSAPRLTPSISKSLGPAAVQTRLWTIPAIGSRGLAVELAVLAEAPQVGGQDRVHRRRLDAEGAERPLLLDRGGRDDVVGLQEVDLVAGQERGEGQERKREGEELAYARRHRDQWIVPPGFAQHPLHQLAVGDDLGPAQLVD